VCSQGRQEDECPIFSLNIGVARKLRQPKGLNIEAFAGIGFLVKEQRAPSPPSRRLRERCNLPSRVRTGASAANAVLHEEALKMHV